MVQGYTQQDCGSKSGRSSYLGQEDPKKEIPSQEPSSTVTKPSGVRILVELRMTNGMAEYLNDGSLPIDNNLAERVICPLTTQRMRCSTLVAMKVQKWPQLIIV